MKKRYFLLLLCFLGLIFETQIVNAQSITGQNPACQGSQFTYTSHFTAFHPGATYSWSIIPAPAGTFMGPTSSSATILWAIPGSATIKVVRDSAGHGLDSATLAVTIIPPPHPYITTTVIVGCQSFDTTKLNPKPPLILGDTPCVNVCDSSYVTYTANGGLPGDRFTWNVTGGSLVASTSNTVTVWWNVATTSGTITLTDSSAGGCYATTTGCVKIIPRPNAKFAIDSSSGPGGISLICEHDKVFFKDQSTVDPTSSIINWYWNFGDGTSSNLQNPVHSYSKSGADTVWLVITNACGCIDSAEYILNISGASGPRILCPSTVCQHDTTTLYTPDSCTGASYHWSWNTSYAHAIGSTTGTHITLQWDSASVDGYAYVSLSESSCATVCPGITTVKIPVVQTYPTVTKPALICVHNPIQMSIPLWPGTQYDWGVIGHPGTIVSGHHSNVVAMQFDTAGTYTVHVWYQNRLKLCGGDLKFTVAVQNIPTITNRSSTELCLGNAINDSLSGTLVGKWTLAEPLGAGAPFDTLTGHNYSKVVTVPGTYTLTVAPLSPTAFCPPNPIYYTVTPNGPFIDTIIGPRTVCGSTYYQYKAGNDAPGYTYQWKASSGSILFEFTGDSVTISWNFASDTSTDTLYVNRVALDSPYCHGPTDTIKIKEKHSHPSLIWIPSLVCPNSTLVIDEGVPADNDTYIKWWAVDVFGTPNSPARIISGSDAEVATIAFSNSSTTGGEFATVYCNVIQCGGSINDTPRAALEVMPNPTLDLSVPTGSFCSGTTVTLSTADTGAVSYVWNFGDGTKLSTTSDTVTHVYVGTPGGGTTSFPITVTAYDTFGSRGCPVSGVGFATVFMNNGPYVIINTRDTTTYCGSTPVRDTLMSYVSGATGTVSYQWYKSGVPIAGATHDTLDTKDTGTFYVVATDGSTGCGNISDSITIVNTGTCGTCTHTVTATLSNGCNGVISATGGGGGATPHWIAPDGVISNPNSTSTTITYSKAGYYPISFTETFPCSAGVTHVDSVPLVAQFTWLWSCPSPTYYEPTFEDYSSVLPGWTEDSVKWVIKNGATTYATSSGKSFDIPLPGATYTVTETVYVHRGSASQNCSVTITLPVPTPPSGVTLTATTENTCEGNPITLSTAFSGSGTPSIANYYWTLGDGFISLLANPTWSYAWLGGANPEPFPASIQITDSIGCTRSQSAFISIWQNSGSNFIVGNSEICPGLVDSLRDSLTGGYPLVSYLWTDGTTTPIDVVSSSGYYNVELRDTHNCLGKPRFPLEVFAISDPDLTIRGSRSYCSGQTVHLSYFRDSPYVYQWFVNGMPWSAGDNLYLSGITGPDTLVVKLVATYTYGFICAGSTDTSLNDTIIIHANPAPPTVHLVSVISCPKYELKLTANSIAGYQYNWSNGASGINDTIYSGGAYRLWCTDTFGCQNFVDTLIPNSPESYMDWFPTGCYLLCNQSAPDSLYGPPGIFALWQWLVNSTVISGSGHINPLSIPYSPTAYNDKFALTNTVGCVDTSDTLHMQYIDCSAGCPSVLPPAANISAVCDNLTTAPAGYIITIHNLSNATPNTINATIGVTDGPIYPFSITIPPFTTINTLLVNFSTLRVPAPSSVKIGFSFYYPGLPHPCYDTATVSLPSCGWISERATQATTEQQPIDTVAQVATGMVVYPNPAKTTVTVNYNFGKESDVARSVVLYDMTGRIIANLPVKDVTGTVTINTGELPSGNYIVGMRQQGTMIQVDHLTIAH